MRFLATAAFSLEGLVARELNNLGLDAKARSGGAVFEGGWQDAFKANLWLRCADRVRLIVGEFPAQSFEELFEGVKALPWADIMPRAAIFPVSATCVRSKLMSVPDTQAIVKKAVAESLRRSYRQQAPIVEETGPRFAIDAHIHADQVLLSVDLTGQGLSYRGYRKLNAIAPLRESLAAALVMLSPWRGRLPLYDPMCGSGTIGIEAAMIACDKAPGLERDFDMQHWGHADYNSLRQEAVQRFEAAKTGKTAVAFLSDNDPEMGRIARIHIENAGLSPFIEFRLCDAGDVRPDGDVVVNPPYGQRLGDDRQALDAARLLGDMFRGMQSGSMTVIAPQNGFERAFGRRADKRRRLYNATTECEAMTFFLPRKTK